MKKIYNVKYICVCVCVCVLFLILIIFLTFNFNNIKNMSKTNSSNESNLIPRSILFGNPDKINVQVDNSGKFISYIAPLDGVLNIYVSPIDKPNEGIAVTNDKHRGITRYFWTYNDKLIYIQDKDGDENDSIYLVDVDKMVTKPLFSEVGVKTLIFKVSHKHKDNIVIGINKRSKEFFDIYNLNLIDGSLELIYENNKYPDIFLDDDYNIKFGTYQLEDGSQITDKFILNSDKKYTYEQFMYVKYEDTNTTGIVGINKLGDKLYIVDSRKSNTNGLYTYDLNTNEESLIFSNDQADVSNILIHRTEKNIQAVYYNYEKQNYKIIDEAITNDFDFLSKYQVGEFNIVSQTLDDKIWIISYMNDIYGGKYYIYDRLNKKMTFLFTARSQLGKYKLAKMTPVIIKARDGLNLVSYLTLPINTIKDRDLDEDLGIDKINYKKSPLVLYVHGGPTARDEWGYNAVHQWLANRGYAVLSVNYRGSTGFGKNFINAGNGEWAGKMHDDLIDAVNWAIGNGITTKDNVAIMGGSYGGYATLVGLTMTPDVFTCGVDIVGPSNLETLLNTVPEYWKPMKNDWKIKIGGDPETEAGREILRKKSPITYVTNIKKPLLIAQGANDPRVKQSESDQIVEVMKNKNIPVTYVLYSDEGHGFARPENKISFFAITEYFLANNFCHSMESNDGINIQTSSINSNSDLNNNNVCVVEKINSKLLNKSTADIKHGKEFLKNYNEDILKN